MRTIKFLLLYILLSLCVGIEANAQLKHLDKSADFGEHPRLLLFDSDIQQIKSNIEKNQLWGKIDDVIQSESRKLFEVDAVKRIKTGRRLLSRAKLCDGFSISLIPIASLRTSSLKQGRKRRCLPLLILKTGTLPTF